MYKKGNLFSCSARNRNRKLPPTFIAKADALATTWLVFSVRFLAWLHSIRCCLFKTRNFAKNRSSPLEKVVEVSYQPMGWHLTLWLICPPKPLQLRQVTCTRFWQSQKVATYGRYFSLFLLIIRFAKSKVSMQTKI